MTEEEAKTKWCPMARIFIAGDYWQSTNGADLLTYSANDMRPLSRCIGSACMMWRKESSKNADFSAELNARIIDAELTTTNGYCGLAGKP